MLMFCLSIWAIVALNLGWIIVANSGYVSLVEDG
jgi:hypothetical protein